MVALNTAYAAPKNAADPKNRVGDFFHEDRASVGKNRWAKRLNTQEKSSYHYETASGRSNWPNRDPVSDQGHELVSRPNWVSIQMDEIESYLEFLILEISNGWSRIENRSYDNEVSLYTDWLEVISAEYLFTICLEYYGELRELSYFRGNWGKLFGGNSYQGSSVALDYGFVFNNPIGLVDLLGLAPTFEYDGGGFHVNTGRAAGQPAYTVNVDGQGNFKFGPKGNHPLPEGGAEKHFRDNFLNNPNGVKKCKSVIKNAHDSVKNGSQKSRIADFGRKFRSATNTVPSSGGIGGGSGGRFGGGTMSPGRGSGRAPRGGGGGGANPLMPHWMP
jgi:hypothetical protein